MVNGYFPSAIGDGDLFEVIVFNDVLEHIPDARETLRACLDHLTTDGVVVISAPFSEGVFFRMARFMRAHKLWDRLWQRHFFTPHVHYFSERSLRDLAASLGCVMTVPRSLSTLAREGTWERIDLDPALGRLSKRLIWCLVMVSLPILAMLPADTRFVMIRKARAQEPGPPAPSSS